jgi:2'-5' RNA ligase
LSRPALRPSPDTGLVIVARLPPELEALRRRSIADAALGMPAHITLLYPFAEPAAIDDSLLEEVAVIVRRHPAMTLRLQDGRRWPDTLYASVQPDEPLQALQGELAAAFPSLPLYGGGIDFVPHVSIVEGDAARTADALDDPAWTGLPCAFRTRAVALVRVRGGRWTSDRTFPLAGARDGA